MKLPLPSDFFQCPPLSSAKVVEIKRMAQEAIHELIYYAKLHDGPIEWTLAANEKYVKVYKGTDESAPPNVTTWLAQSTVRATLEEVADMFYCDSTPAYKEYIQTYYDELKDGIQLYTIAKPAPAMPHHYIGVNWVCQVMPAKGFVVKNRDWCFVECQQECVLNGKRAWLRAFRSISLPCCPDLQAEMDFIRAHHFRSGMIYTESDQPGVLDVMQLNQVCLNGDLQSSHLLIDSVVRYGFKKRYKTMAAKMERGLRTYRLRGKQLTLARHPVNDQSHYCTLCLKKFGVIQRRPSQCQLCGQAVCRRQKCSTLYQVGDTNKNTIRLCTFCFINPHSAHLPADDCSSTISLESSPATVLNNSELDQVLMTYSKFDLKLTTQDDDLLYSNRGSLQLV